MKYLVFLTTFLVPALALAQDGASEMPWWGQMLVATAGVVGTALLGFLGRLLNQAFDYLAKKSKLTFLANVDEVVMGYVTKLYNEEIRHVKAAAADGKLTKEEKKRFAKIAVEQAKEHFGYKTLGQVFGSKVDDALGSRVEKAVTIAKNAGKAVKAAANP